MKKRTIRVLAILMVMMLCLMGCKGESKDDDSKDDTKTENADTSGEDTSDDDSNTDDTDNDAVDDDANDDGGSGEADDDAEEQTSTAIIVVPAADGTAFEEMEVTVDAVTPQNLVNALIEQGILLDGVEVIDMQMSEQEGETCIDLNMNKAFEDNLSQQGTNGENYILGSLCNTLLKNYNAAKIKVMTEGAALATGHNIYDSYLGYFN